MASGGTSARKDQHTHGSFNGFRAYISTAHLSKRGSSISVLAVCMRNGSVSVRRSEGQNATICHVSFPHQCDGERRHSGGARVMLSSSSVQSLVGGGTFVVSKELIVQRSMLLISLVYTQRQ